MTASTTASNLVAWFKAKGIALRGNKGLWKWCVGAVVAAIAFCVIITISRRLKQQEALIAQLQLQRDIALKDKEFSEFKSRISSEEDEISKHEDMAKVAQGRVLELEAEIARVTHEKTETENSINAIRNWRDVDSYLAKRS